MTDETQEPEKKEGEGENAGAEVPNSTEPPVGAEVASPSEPPHDPPKTHAKPKREPFHPFAPHTPDPPRVDPESEPTPWIEQPSTVRMLWIGSAIILALLVLADLFVHHHEPHFVIETSIGFSAWYGFATCVAMVVLSKKVVGFVLKRRDTYYDPPTEDGGDEEKEAASGH
jgi:hypothetical protein